MNLNSTLFDRLRTRPGEAEAAPAAQRCEHPGCARAGEFRAPKGRFREGEYWRFCLDHVKAYNASYNYFNGMSDDAVAAFQKDAVTGHRPTWTMGVGGKPEQVADLAARAARGEAVPDPFGILSGRAERMRAGPQAAPERAVGNAARRAFEALSLAPPSDKTAIRARYKELVKRLHPDVNGGDRSREDGLRAIIDAYNTLKAAGFA